MKTSTEYTGFYEHTTLFPTEMSDRELLEAFRSFLEQGNYVVRKKEATGFETGTTFTLEKLE